MNDYEQMPESTRERLENEFRNLLMIIPFAKRLELEQIVRAECYAQLQKKIHQFDEHWSLYETYKDSEISARREFVDPDTGKVHEREIF